MKLLTLAANEWQLHADDPCTGLKRFPEQKRERYFSDAELTQPGGALAAAERDGTELPCFVLLVRLLATTGIRLSELLGFEWRDVDLPGRMLRLADAKAGGRTMDLGAPAGAILESETERSSDLIHDIDPGASLKGNQSRTRLGPSVRPGRTNQRSHS